jgi:DNA-binding transcriptional regulator YiaG
VTSSEVKAIRHKVGLTQAELATLLRISDLRTVRRWETGEIAVSGPASIVLELLANGELPLRFNGAGKPRESAAERACKSS